MDSKAQTRVAVISDSLGYILKVEPIDFANSLGLKAWEKELNENDTKMLDLTPTERDRVVIDWDAEGHRKKKLGSKVGMGLESRIQFMIYKVWDIYWISKLEMLTRQLDITDKGLVKRLSLIH